MGKPKQNYTKEEYGKYVSYCLELGVCPASLLVWLAFREYFSLPLEIFVTLTHVSERIKFATTYVPVPETGTYCGLVLFGWSSM